MPSFETRRSTSREMRASAIRIRLISSSGCVPCQVLSARRYVPIGKHTSGERTGVIRPGRRTSGSRAARTRRADGGRPGTRAGRRGRRRNVADASAIVAVERIGLTFAAPVEPLHHRERDRPPPGQGDGGGATVPEAMAPFSSRRVEPAPAKSNVASSLGMPHSARPPSREASLSTQIAHDRAAPPATRAARAAWPSARGSAARHRARTSTQAVPTTPRVPRRTGRHPGGSSTGTSASGTRNADACSCPRRSHGSGGYRSCAGPARSLAPGHRRCARGTTGSSGSRSAPGAASGTTGCSGATAAHALRTRRPAADAASTSPRFGHIDIARSACAVIVSDGLTPRFTDTVEPSTTCSPSWP